MPKLLQLLMLTLHAVNLLTGDDDDTCSDNTALARTFHHLSQ
jgi:hypothetical protein